MDITRFVGDSTRRDAIDQRSLELLNRIDARVLAMYCEGKPPGCQEVDSAALDAP